jgi:hypothetical protein
MWIVPSVCGRAALVPLVAACRESGMTRPVSALVEIGASAAGLGRPANWSLIPAVGRLEPVDCVHIASLAAAPAEPIGILPADHSPVSDGWDVALERAAGRWNIAYSNDLLSAGKHPVGGADRVTGAVCIGGELARILRPVLPAGMTLADARIAWATLGRALGALVYLKGVVVEMRPERVAGAKDAALLRDPERRARLFRWLNDEVRPLVRKVREARAADAMADADADRAV